MGTLLLLDWRAAHAWELACGEVCGARTPFALQGCMASCSQQHVPHGGASCWELKSLLPAREEV